MPTTREGVTLNGEPIGWDFGTEDDDPYCYVCGRCTDHVGEHDDLTDVGLASYESCGVVAWRDNLTHDDLLQWFGFNFLMTTVLRDSGWYWTGRYENLLTDDAEHGILRS